MPQTDALIRTAPDRVVDTFTTRPGPARSTYHARAEAGPGLSATTTEGRWTLAFDMPKAMGGTSGAPTPGVCGRATLLACLAIGLPMEALRAGLPHGAIAVTMECNWTTAACSGSARRPPATRVSA